MEKIYFKQWYSEQFYEQCLNIIGYFPLLQLTLLYRKNPQIEIINNILYFKINEDDLLEHIYYTNSIENGNCIKINNNIYLKINETFLINPCDVVFVLKKTKKGIVLDYIIRS